MCNLFPLQARSHGDAEAASAKPVPTPARSDQAPPAAPAAPAECMAAKVEPEAGYALFLELFANNILYISKNQRHFSKGSVQM